MVNIRLTSLLRVVICGFALFPFSLLFFPDHPYLDSTCIALTLLFSFILYLACGRFSNKYPPAIIVSAVLIFFILARLAFVVVYPESFLGWSLVDPESFAKSLKFINFATVACFFGIGFGMLLGRTGKAEKPDCNPKRTILLAKLFVLALVFKLAVYYTSGFVGVSGSGAHLSFFVRYIARLINPVPLLMMFSASYYYSRKFHRPILLITLGTVYGGYYLMLASRGGLYMVAIMALCYAVFFFGNVSWRTPPLKIISTVLLAPILFGLSLWMFNSANELRIHQWGQHDMSFTTLVDCLAPPAAEDLEFLLKHISYRVSLVEPLYYVMNGVDNGYHDISHLVNVKTALLSSLDRMIPGRQFEGLIKSEFAIGFIYNINGILSYSHETGAEGFVGYEWGFYGISYQLFSTLGGCIFVFLFTALIAFFFAKCRSGLTFKKASLGMLVIFVLHNWIRCLGLDNLADGTWWTLVIMLLYLELFNTAFKPKRGVAAARSLPQGNVIRV